MWLVNTFIKISVVLGVLIMLASCEPDVPPPGQIQMTVPGTLPGGKTHIVPHHDHRNEVELPG